MIDGKEVIVVGLAGLDCEHGCHTELHPVYALFVHLQDDPLNDKWTFFVRNWGTEGKCGCDREDLISTDLKIRIPNFDAEDFEILGDTKIYSTLGALKDTLRLDIKNCEHDLILRFYLGPAKEKNCFIGDLNIKWKKKNFAIQKDKNSFNRKSCPEFKVQDEDLKDLSENIDSIGFENFYVELRKNHEMNKNYVQITPYIKKGHCDEKNFSVSTLTNSFQPATDSSYFYYKIDERKSLEKRFRK